MSEPDPSLPHIYKIIPQVKAEIGAISKDKQMKGGGGYNYRSIDDMLDAAHDGLVRHGCFFAPQVVDSEYTKNDRATHALLTIEYLVYGPLGDFVTLRVIGEAADYSDKATNKAFTAAFKVALSQLFAIPYSGDDADDYRPDLAGTESPNREVETSRAQAPRAKSAPVSNSVPAKPAKSKDGIPACSKCGKSLAGSPFLKKGSDYSHRNCPDDPKVVEDAAHVVAGAFPGTTAEDPGQPF